MSQFVDGNTKSFVAGGAIAQHLRVKISSGKLAVAGLTDRNWIGTAMTEAFADGEVISVKLASGAGSHKMIAADALTAGDPVFTQASGKVGDSESTAYYIGVALEDAGADGDVVEVMVNPTPAAVI